MADELPRKLGAFDAAGVVVGAVVGTGIFIVPAKMAAQIGSPGLILLVWLAGGFLSLMGGLTYAELGARFPAAGGQYVYLREIYGPVWGFLYGWVCFLVIQSGSLAAVAVGFAKYAGQFVTLSPNGIVAVAVAAICGLSVINILSTRFGATVQNAFSCATLFSLLALIFLGAFSGAGSASHFSPFFPADKSLGDLIQPMALAVVGVLWSYDGWVCASYLAGEVRNPKRSLPLSLGLSLAVITLLYCAVNGIYIYLLGLNGIAGAPDERVASAAATILAGPRGGEWMALAILAASFGCINSGIISVPRVYFAMAVDRVFFPAFARLHPRYQTPVFAIVLQAVWSSILAVSGRYDDLYTYVVFVAWLFYGMTALGLILLRRREPAGTQLPYRVPGYPLTPLLFVLASLVFLINTAYTSPVPSLAGLAITAAGLPGYAYFRRTRREEFPDSAT